MTKSEALLHKQQTVSNYNTRLWHEKELLGALSAAERKFTSEPADEALDALNRLREHLESFAQNW